MSRITRDQMFMQIARTVAKRGTCDRARVGAVLVNSGNNIVSIGYNGSPSGSPHCDEAGHIMHHNHCIRTAHAEENCIDRVEGSFQPHSRFTLYVTHYPCVKCQAILYEWCKQNNTHITIVYDKMYNVPTLLSQICNTRLTFTKYEGDEENEQKL